MAPYRPRPISRRVLFLMLIPLSFVLAFYSSAPSALAEDAAYLEVRQQAEEVKAQIEEDRAEIASLEDDLGQLAAERENLGADQRSAYDCLDSYARAFYRERANTLSELVGFLMGQESMSELLEALNLLEMALLHPQAKIAAIQSLIDENSERASSVEQAKARLESEMGQRSQDLSAIEQEAERLWQDIVTTSNNALAVAACRIAYSRPVFYDPDKVYGGTAEAFRVSKAVKVGGVRSCNVVAAIASRWSGVDTSQATGCKGQWTHMEDSPRWIRVGRWNGDNSMLQPGDVLLRVNGQEGQTIDHSCVFVGHDIVEQVYETYLKGTDADLGEPPADACFVSAHGTKNKTAAPCVGNAKWAYADKRMTVFRCIDPENSGKYAGL